MTWNWRWKLNLQLFSVLILETSEENMNLVQIWSIIDIIVRQGDYSLFRAISLFPTMFIKFCLLSSAEASKSNVYIRYKVTRELKGNACPLLFLLKLTDIFITETYFPLALCIVMHNVADNFLKHRDKRRICSKQAISPFATMFSTFYVQMDFNTSWRK